MSERSVPSSFPASQEFRLPAGVELESQTTFDIKEKVVYGIWRSRWIVAVFLLIGGIGGLIAAAASPNTYTSVARLRLRAGKVETFSLEELLGVGSDRPTAMSTIDEIFLLEDPVIYENVIDGVGGPQAILVPPDPTEHDNTETPLHIALLHRIQKALFDTVFKPHCTDKHCVECRQQATAVLQSRTTLVPEKSSSVISLVHLSFSPELAEKTAHLLVDASVARHKKEFAVGQYTGMNKEAIQSTYKSLEDAKIAYEEHRQKCGFIDISVQQDNLLAKMQKIDIDLQSSEAELVGVKARLGTLNSQREVTAETVMKISVYQQMGINPDWLRWEQRVHDLRTQFGDVDLQIEKSKEIREEKKRLLRPTISEAEERFKDFEDKKWIETVPQQSVEIPNDAYYELVNRILQFEAEESRLNALIVSNTASLAATKEDLNRLLMCERLHDKWDLEIKEKEENYQKLSQKNAELDAMSQLDVQPEANLRVFQLPTLPTDKDGPQRSKFVGLGIFGGLAAGVSIALLVQFLDRRLRYPSTVERELKVPLIGVVPEVPALHGILRRQRVA